MARIVVSMSKWAGDDDDGRLAGGLLEAGQDVQARAVGQHHVQHDQVGGDLGGLAQRLLGARGGVDLVESALALALLLEVHPERLEQAKVVVDEK
jgi:hypothetical protein